MDMEQQPKLEKATFTFSQEGNCVDGGSEDLTIRCESSLGIDGDEGCFYVLETEGWSIDSVEELQKLFDRINKVITKSQKDHLTEMMEISQKAGLYEDDSPKTDFLGRPADRIFTEVDIADAIYMSKVGNGSVNGPVRLLTHEIIQKLKDRKWPKKQQQ